MTYEIWDLDTGNLLGDFASESAALAAVNRISRAGHGGDLALEVRDPHGRIAVISGLQLLQKARRATWPVRATHGARASLKAAKQLRYLTPSSKRARYTAKGERPERKKPEK